MAQPPTRAEVHRAALLVQQTAQWLQQAVEVRLRSQGLTWPAAAVLAVLRVHGPQSITTLGRFVLMQPQSMTTLIDRLERAGLVERRRHPTDRRMVQVSLTETGATAASDADAAFTEVAASVFGGTALRQLAGITALLPQVRDAVAPIAGIPADHFTYATDTLALRGGTAA